MRKHAMPEIREGGVNVTPLIDIVMCLIIFFMLVAKIGVDAGVDPTISIPQTILGTDIRKMDIPNSLTLNVRPGGLDEPNVSALVSGQLTELKLVDAGSRTPLLDSLKFFRFGKDLKPGGSGPNEDNPAFNVIIRGDREMDYRFLEPVLKTCAEASVKSVNFTTENAGG
jgi:biopolymer transport protein ExbD